MGVTGALWLPGVAAVPEQEFCLQSLRVTYSKSNDPT